MFCGSYSCLYHRFLSSLSLLGLGWPLNFHFVFDLMLVSSVVTILLSFFLPKSIEKKRQSPPIVTAVTSNPEEPDSDLLPANESSNELSLGPANIIQNDFTVPSQDMKPLNSELPIQNGGGSDRDSDDASPFVNPPAETSSTTTSEWMEAKTESDRI